MGLMSVSAVSSERLETRQRSRNSVLGHKAPIPNRQLLTCLNVSSYLKEGFLRTVPRKLDMETHTCNLSTQVEAGGQILQSW